MKFRSVLLLTLGLTLVGCEDDATSPTVNGSLSFTYTGAGSSSARTYAASGIMPSTLTSPGTGAWAAGGVDQTGNYTVIGAAIPKVGTTWDITNLVVTRTTAGTSPIGDTCEDSESTECTGVFVSFGMNPDGDTFSFSCYLTSGTVTISAISSSNVTGTFAGSGSCFTAAGIESGFTVTNGTFNVGLTTLLLE